MKTSYDSANIPIPNRAIVKVQSVRIHHLAESQIVGTTIGQQIDRFLQESVESGSFPNRVTIDLNPKEDNPADMD